MALKRSFVFAAAFTIAGCGFAANLFEATEFEVVQNDLHVSGLLNSKTHEQFQAIIAENPDISRLVLGVIEGSSDDEANFPFYAEVRARGLGTYLTSTSEVYSGGADLFIAGKTRVMEQGAKIGVHSWSDGQNDATAFARTSPEHDLNRGYVEAMLGVDDWYWFTITAAPAADIHIMTPAEIQEYGLLTQPVIRN